MHPDFADATQMLPVPHAGCLSRKRVEGKVCVWCRQTLDDHIDLEPRLSVVAGQLERWWPRACRPCAGRKAAHTYQAHIRACASCTHRDYCLDSHALHGLALECG
ncbi:hypothetical protein [Streptomyces sp. GQFP]|uniref:hypothetical protein n=1 Tax=Streptomyces sp. GQFP TaxID=2907545 RepID=UPI001F1EDB8C|nr:hypothetical protein [Streptomyces sp. GQFP]UIX32842.1 hypothetical protein LUX31_24060 [Streptomyces sp. GQFP]